MHKIIDEENIHKHFDRDYKKGLKKHPGLLFDGF